MTIEKALAGEYSFYSDPKTALDSYHEFGFHIEKNFLETDYCDFLIKEAHSLSNAKANNFKPAIMTHKENDTFLDAIRHKKTIDILQFLIGGMPEGIQTQFFYCKPGTRGFSLHQDNFYIQAKPEVFVSVWGALVDTYQENGGLIIFPGSHKEGRLSVRKLNLDLDPGQDRNANNEETVVPETYVAQNLTLAKGSSLFIHSQLVHGSNVNKSDHFRYSLLNLYIKQGEDFRSGNSARREPIALA